MVEVRFIVVERCSKCRTCEASPACEAELLRWRQLVQPKSDAAKEEIAVAAEPQAEVCSNPPPALAIGVPSETIRAGPAGFEAAPVEIEAAPVGMISATAETETMNSTDSAKAEEEVLTKPEDEKRWWEDEAHLARDQLEADYKCAKATAPLRDAPARIQETKEEREDAPQWRTKAVGRKTRAAENEAAETEVSGLVVTRINALERTAGCTAAVKLRKDHKSDAQVIELTGEKQELSDCAFNSLQARINETTRRVAFLAATIGYVSDGVRKIAKETNTTVAPPKQCIINASLKGD
eukprot:TRINITY_DN69367_c0_g1_i1.p1 TRINITY_DN69367_c0_g1~~TRINITY_DN69367_c0_g1_i1.p1  ORF type:complete len:295 (+),score=52.22 TRINITY_DN69367_c0_g1_i1:43-927(+)